MPIKLACPECGRILGDTKITTDCHINCNGCKQTVHIQMMVAETADYLWLQRKDNKKEKKNNDKSKR